MFESSKRNLALVGAGAALTLCLATGAAAGVVPMVASSSGTSDSATVALDVAAPEAAAAPAPAAPAPAAPAPEVAPPPTTAPPVTAPPATTPRRSTPRPVEAAPAAEPAPAAPAPAPAAPAAPTTVARTNPSSSQVKGAISSLGLPIAPSEAQARQFGDSVCDAFDQGQTFAQVKASALQAASQIPLITVSAAAVDTAVRNAVNLFCPGHAPKLV